MGRRPWVNDEMQLWGYRKEQGWLSYSIGAISQSYLAPIAIKYEELMRNLIYIINNYTNQIICTCYAKFRPPVEMSAYFPIHYSIPVSRLCVLLNINPILP
jgi:hypothetical protein